MCRTLCLLQFLKEIAFLVCACARRYYPTCCTHLLYMHTPDVITARYVNKQACSPAVCEGKQPRTDKREQDLACLFSVLSPCVSHQIYGDEPSLDGCPVAEGELESMVTGNTFIGLRKYYEQVIRLVLTAVFDAPESSPTAVCIEVDYSHCTT